MCEKLTSQNAIQRIIFMGLVCLVVFLIILRQKACNELYEAQLEIERKNALILGLENAISTQNAAINKMKAYSELSETRYAEAVRVVTQKNAQLDKTINTLKAQKGTTCSEAMPLVDAVVYVEK